MADMNLQERTKDRSWLALREAGRFLLSAPMVPVLVLSALAISALVPGFLSGANLRNMAWLFGPLLIAALGITFVFLIGGIDLSIGSTLSLSTIATAIVIRETGAILPGAVAGMLVGMLVGAINGFTIAFLE
ncbi:hypothetical protein GIY56_17250 [Paracoccus sp. YIM 132242]|uniref:ABC transporter permease n=1 Tax=Paracoccus lichenicola TaxID=2665644 RepID=A0A6L6HXI1_9RHOB|nr:ABC transporter permease [Paracoccus lichenicola]MTE02038.1 hypothetical protein [Paracoccus lichenicola]